MELPEDVHTVRSIHAAAFAKTDGIEPVEARLLDELRTCEGWLPQYSLVAQLVDRAKTEG